MVDIHSPKTRSSNMRAIRGVNTKPELIVRKLLHNSGYRFRITPNNLPSKPDIYLPKHKACVLVNGCFWHGHNCHLFKWPKTNPQFWQSKISDTIQRDNKNIRLLREYGLKTLIVWECALKGKLRLPQPVAIQLIERWIHHSQQDYELDSHGLKQCNR
tara:strand:+ start:185 stop:658 length:474 start_codon:yes stop_codon:yes gene_type:complete